MFGKTRWNRNDTIKLNKYSSTPQQIDEWFNTLKSKDICSRKREIDKDARLSLKKLKRGVYLKNKIIFFKIMFFLPSLSQIINYHQVNGKII